MRLQERWPLGAILSVVVSAGGCFSALEDVEGLRLRCEDTVDCPEDWTCDRIAQLCVAPDQDSLTLSAVETRDDDGDEQGVFSAVGPRATLDVSVRYAGQVTRAYARLAPTSSPGNGLDPIDCSVDATHLRCGFDLAALRDESLIEDGSYALTVFAFSDAGAATSASTTVGFDFSPPALLASSVSVTYVPAPGSLLFTPSALAPQGSLIVRFALDEPTTVPAVSLGEAPTAIDLVELAPPAGTFFQLRLPAPFAAAPGSWTSGTYPVHARVTDEVGNPADLVVADVVVDVDAPLPPDPGVPGAARFVREPWGSDDSQGEVRMRLDVQPAVLPELASLAVWSAAEGGVLLGRAILGSDFVVTEDGSFAGVGDPDPVPGAPYTVELLPADRLTVYLSSVDDAGNESARQPVQEVAWVATLGGKRAGQTLQNPHRAVGHPYGADIPLAAPGDDADEVDGDALARIDATAMVTTGQVRWANTSTPQGLFSLASLDGPAMVYDEGSARFVLLAGEDLTTSLRVFGDGEAAAVVVPPPAPVPSGRRQLVYRRTKRDVLIFGGSPGGGIPAETWRFDGSGLAKLPLDGPSQRVEFGFAAHGLTEEVLLVGGRDGTGTPQPDTWRLTAAGWTEVNGPGPGPRRAPGLAYDPAGDRFLLFGGLDETGTARGDTWAFEGGAWTDLNVTGPSARYGLAMVSDFEGGRILLHGGRDAAGANPEVWAWDGTAWSDITPAAGPVVARTSHAAAVDAGRGELVIVGGSAANGPAETVPVRAEAWRLTDEGWVSQALFGVRGDRGRIYARVPSGAVMSVGGHIQDVCAEGEVAHEVTTLSPRGAGLAPFAFLPLGNAISYLAAAPFASDGRVLLFGGKESNGGCAGHPASSRTFWLDEAGIEEALPATVPPGGEPAAMAYDPVRDHVVLFTQTAGGVAETWLFDGDDWSLATPAAQPPARVKPAMGFDPVTDEVMLLGGYNAGAPITQCGLSPCDVWTFDGAEWTDRTPATHPWSFASSTVGGYEFVPDAAGDALQVMVLSALGVVSTSWDGTTFVEDGGGPGVPFAPALPLGAADVTRAFVDDGRWTLASGAESWQVEPGAARAAEVFSFSLLPAGLAPDEVESVTVSAVAGGASGDGSTDGAGLWIWDAGAFRPLTEHGEAGLAPLSATLTAADLQGQPPDTLHVRIQNRGGGAGGQVATDYVELRVIAHVPPL